MVAVGEIDIATSPDLADVLRDAQARAPHVVVDLERTTFIDMGGVYVLLAAAAHAHGSGGTFDLVRPTGAVARLLGLTGADHALHSASRLTLPPAEEAGDGARAALPSPARTWPSPLPSRTHATLGH